MLSAASPSTTILHRSRGGEIARIGAEEVRQRYRVDPEQLPDSLLRGDPSDKLPGAAGVQPKRAAQLVQRYGALDGVLKAGLFQTEAEMLRYYRFDCDDRCQRRFVAMSVAVAGPRLAAMEGEQIATIPVLAGNGSTRPILLKNSNFRGDHNSEDRWQPRWKFPWGLSGATNLSAYEPLLALAVATTRGDNAFRAELGFSRHLNFRLFQQYRPFTALQIDPMNGREAPESGLRGRLRRKRISVRALRPADEWATPSGLAWRPGDRYDRQPYANLPLPVASELPGFPALVDALSS